MTLSSIAKLLKKSESYVRILCERIKQDSREGKIVLLVGTQDQTISPYPATSIKRYFTPEQIQYLTNEETLNRQAAKSLLERIALFRAEYPGHKITSYRLRQLYKECNIKYKFVR